MNEPLIDSSNAKVNAYSTSHCFSITWEGIQLNLSDTDKLILNHCLACENFKGYNLISILCSKQSLIGEGNISDLLKIVDGEVQCKCYKRRIKK